MKKKDTTKPTGIKDKRITNIKIQDKYIKTISIQTFVWKKVALFLPGVDNLDHFLTHL